MEDTEDMDTADMATVTDIKLLRHVPFKCERSLGISHLCNELVHRDLFVSPSPV